MRLPRAHFTLRQRMAVVILAVNLAGTLLTAFYWTRQANAVGMMGGGFVTMYDDSAILYRPEGDPIVWRSPSVAGQVRVWWPTLLSLTVTLITIGGFLIGRTNNCQSNRSLQTSIGSLMTAVACMGLLSAVWSQLLKQPIWGRDLDWRLKALVALYLSVSVISVSAIYLLIPKTSKNPIDKS